MKTKRMNVKIKRTLTDFKNTRS